MTLHPYPVVAESALRPVRRNLLGRGRRELSDLPEQLPGTVLVFEVHGAYRAMEDRRHIRGNEDHVVDAVSVSQVYVRDHAVEVDFAIPSADPADDFSITAVFHCRVTRPEVVVAAGLTDLATPLRHHLSQDRQLATLGLEHRVEEINEVRQHVTARVSALCSVRPPKVDGVSVDLAAVRVRTPDELRTHRTRVRDTVWSQEVTDLERSAEDRDFDRMRARVEAGPNALTAVGISRNQIHLSDAVRDQRESEALQRRQLLELIDKLPAGTLDTMPFDPAVLVDALTASLTGVKPDPAGRLAAEPARLSLGERAPGALDEDGVVG